MTDVQKLIERFNWMRDSGVCSPTTRGLLDDAQAALEAQEAKITAALEVIDDGDSYEVCACAEVARILSDGQEVPNE